jgi:ABC-type glycerol-3-phosphate transport system substrate-binding protein
MVILGRAINLRTEESLMARKGLLHRFLSVAFVPLVILASGGCSSAAPATQSVAPTAAPVSPSAQAAPVSPSAQAAPVSPSAQPVRLTFWSWMTGDTDKVIQTAMVADFMKENPNISVDLQFIDYGQYWDKLLTSVAGGTSPDIASLEPMRLPGYASKGALLDLTGRLTSWGAKDDFFSGLWVSNTWQSKIYGLPWHASDFILYYNTDLLKAAGFSAPPKNWDELKNIAIATTKKTGNPQTDVYGYVPDLTSPAGVMFNWVPYLWSAGGDLLSADGKTAAFNSPAGTKSLNLLADLYKAGAIPKSSVTGNWQDIQDLWVKGRAALYVSGPNIITLTKSTAPQVHFGTALLPVDQKPAAFHTGGNLVIMANSKHPDEAWKLLQFMTDAKAQRQFSEASNGIWMSSLAVRKSSYDDAFFQKYPEVRAFSQALEYAQISVTPQLDEIMKPVGDAVQSATIGKSPSKDALSAAEKQVNTLLASAP